MSIISWEYLMESVPESLEDKLIFMGGECNSHRIFPFIKDRSFYPTHDPPLYSEQQRGML